MKVNGQSRYYLQIQNTRYELGTYKIPKYKTKVNEQSRDGLQIQNTNTSSAFVDLEQNHSSQYGFRLMSIKIISDTNHNNHNH